MIMIDYDIQRELTESNNEFKIRASREMRLREIEKVYLILGEIDRESPLYDAVKLLTDIFNDILERNFV